MNEPRTRRQTVEKIRSLLIFTCVSVTTLTKTINISDKIEAEEQLHVHAAFLFTAQIVESHGLLIVMSRVNM